MRRYQSGYRKPADGFDWPQAWRAGIVMFIVTVLFLVVIHACAQAEGVPHSNPWLLTWIPHHCCVTNDCCREVTRHDVTSLQDDHWQINASGQILKRTAHSPDGHSTIGVLIHGLLGRHVAIEAEDRMRLPVVEAHLRMDRDGHHGRQLRTMVR